MNWDAISAIGEAIGGLAVIASLIYLGVQTRSSAKATEGLVRRQVAEAAQLAYFTAVESPEFSDLVIRAYLEGDDIEGKERSQMTRFTTSVFLNFEVAFHQHQSGLYGEWEAVLIRRIRVMFRRSKFVREWWLDNSAQFSESFSAAIDNLREEETA